MYVERERKIFRVLSFGIYRCYNTKTWIVKLKKTGIYMELAQILGLVGCDYIIGQHISTGF